MHIKIHFNCHIVVSIYTNRLEPRRQIKYHPLLSHAAKQVDTLMCLE